MTRSLLFGLFCLSVIPLTHALADDGLLAAISEVNEQLGTVWTSGDASAFADFYTEEGAILPPNGSRVDGRANIAAFWQSVMDSGISGFAIETVEVYGDGDAATEVGRYRLSSAEGTVDTGKYIVYWRQVDGRWFMHRDIWNSDRTGADE